MTKNEFEEVIDEILEICKETGNGEKYGYAYAIGRIQAIVQNAKENTHGREN